MTNILFVCTGNTCRSPMAEAIFKHLQKNGRFNVRSAGVFALDGQKISENAKKVLEEKGIHVEHSASKLTEEHIDWATYVFTMTKDHKNILCQFFPKAAEKTFTVSEFVVGKDEEIRDITDPFGSSVETYRKTREELEQLLQKLISKLETN